MRNRFELPVERDLAKSGAVYERFLLGKPRVESEEYRHGVRTLVERHRETHAPIDFRAAMEVIRRCQPFEPDRNVPQDPAAPVKQFPNSLCSSVADALGFRGEDVKRVRFFTTVETFLDTDAGADCVIEVQGAAPGDPSPTLRLDVSRFPEDPEVSRQKEEGRHRIFSNLPPRIEFGEVPEASDPRDLTNPRSAYNLFVDGLADRAAELLRQETAPTPTAAVNQSPEYRKRGES